MSFGSVFVVAAATATRVRSFQRFAFLGVFGQSFVTSRYHDHGALADSVPYLCANVIAAIARSLIRMA
jgi:hypothetical protein